MNKIINLLPILLYLLISMMIGILLMRFVRNKICRWLMLMLTISSALAFLSILKLQPPPPVSIAILSPRTNMCFTSQELHVIGTVSPPNAKVFILVHPEDTDMWWVQSYPTVNKETGQWQGVCYIGTKTMGIGRRYDIIAVGSIVPWIFDALLGRALLPGQTISILPLVNKSDIVVVKRGD